MTLDVGTDVLVELVTDAGEGCSWADEADCAMVSDKPGTADAPDERVAESVGVVTSPPERLLVDLLPGNSTVVGRDGASAEETVDEFVSTTGGISSTTTRVVEVEAPGGDGSAPPAAIGVTAGTFVSGETGTSSPARGIVVDAFAGGVLASVGKGFVAAMPEDCSAMPLSTTIGGTGGTFPGLLCDGYPGRLADSFAGALTGVMLCVSAGSRAVSSTTAVGDTTGVFAIEGADSRGASFSVVMDVVGGAAAGALAGALMGVVEGLLGASSST